MNKYKKTLFLRIESACKATSTKRDNVKVNVKVNVNKVNDKVNDIYSIHSHYKGNHRRGAAAVRLRHLFYCGGGQRPPPL